MTPIPIKHRLAWRWSFSAQRRADIRSGLKTAGVIAAILLAHGITGRMDYEDALRQEIATQETIAQRATLAAHVAEETLAHCLNGRARFTDGRGDYTICSSAWTLNIAKQ